MPPAEPTVTVAAPKESDIRLRAHVRPPGWRPPAPAGRYDLVVLGGGTAGLVAAVGAAGLGARTALVERHLLGGDCLNVGCVPSKALIRAARAAGELRRAVPLGVAARGVDVDFAAVMQRVRERRAAIAPNDAAARIARAGVDVFFGEASFAAEDVVAVDGVRLRFRRAVIATGARPSLPPVPGLQGTPFLTNETIFTLTERPARLIVLGAGPIGCELAQAFARLGSQVTIFDQAPRVLPREGEAASALVAAALEADGVRLALGGKLRRIDHDGARFTVHGEGGSDGDGEAEALLVAAGRLPNVEGLGLERAGIATRDGGIVADDFLRTSNRRVFASGDVVSAFRFTHAADAMSRLILQNALFFGRRRVSRLVIPWVTYTDPEVAHVGAGEADVRASSGRLATITVPLSEIDRAVIDGREDGRLEVHHERGRVRGCTLVAPHAGETIAQVAALIARGGSMKELSATIHPYPTYAEALRKAGDAYRRASLTPAVRTWLERYFRWTR